MLCFLPESGDKWKVRALAIGIITLCIQIILTLGIVIEVIDNWNSEAMFDNDPMIIVMSFMVFAFIAFTFENTVSKYYDFYNNMAWIIRVSPIIRYLDFMTNIVIGFIIVCIALAFLLVIWY